VKRIKKIISIGIVCIIVLVLGASVFAASSTPIATPKATVTPSATATITATTKPTPDLESQIQDEMKKREDSNGIVDSTLGFLIDIVSAITNTFTTNFLKDTLGKLKKCLKKTPELPMVNSIFDIMKPIGTSLIALIFVIEFGKRVIYLETMTVEGIAKPILMLIVGKFLVDKSSDILQTILDIFTSLTTSILGKEGDTLVTNVFTLGVTNGNERIGTNSTEHLAQASAYGCLSLVTLVCAFIILIILYVRVIELGLLKCVAPLLFATLVGNVTHDVFKNYIKYFIAVAAQIVIIAICLKFVNELVNQIGVQKIQPGEDPGNLSAIVSVLAIVLTLFVTQSKKMMLTLLNAR
jgi:hypothetical protein